MMKRTVLSLAAAAVLGVASLTAQSLGDVAKQEQARRQAVPKPSRVYTNADVRPYPVPVPAPATQPPTVSESATDPSDPTQATSKSDAGEAPGRSDYCEDCARDANGRIQRSATAVRAFMRLTKFPNGRPGWIVDHIVPLACGGLDDPSNMQWQTTAFAATKDKTERRDCRDIEPATVTGVIPVYQPPIILLPGRTCGVNSPREQAMASAVTGGAAGAPPAGQPCDVP